MVSIPLEKAIFCLNKTLEFCDANTDFPCRAIQQMRQSDIDAIRPDLTDKSSPTISFFF